MKITVREFLESVGIVIAEHKPDVAGVTKIDSLDGLFKDQVDKHVRAQRLKARPRINDDFKR